MISRKVVVTDSTMRGRLAALMTATTVAVGIAGGMASQAHAAEGGPAASYCGKEHSEERCAPGRTHPPVIIANNGPRTVVTNNQTFLPILDFLIQSPGAQIDEPIGETTAAPEVSTTSETPLAFPPLFQ
jgi:hypothetical protein